MPSDAHIEMIEDLLDETELGRRDLAAENPAWAIFERLSTPEADKLIDWLVAQRDEMR